MKLEAYQVKLFFVLLGSISNGLCMTQLYSYFSMMVQDFGMAHSRSTTGYFGGLLTCAMMTGRTISSHFWGRITDSWGRKPVLMLAIFFTMVLSIAFGFSVNFGMAIAIRFLIGLLAPIGLVSKTCASEIVPEHYQPRATSFYAMSWLLGSMIGAIIGGVLVDPKKQGIVSSGLLADWPYLLPNLVTVAVCIVALLGIGLLMEETLGKKKAALLAEDNQQPELTFVDLTKDRTVLMVSLLYALNYFIYICYSEVVPLWCWANQSNGGLEFSSSKIGIMNAGYTLPMVLFQQQLFKLFITKKGVKWCSVFPSAVLVPVCFVIPWISYTSNVYAIWIWLIGMSFIFTFFSITILTSQFIMSNNCVFKAQRGRANGFSQLTGSFAAAVAPMLVGAVFSATTTSGLPFPLNYTFVFNMMTVLSVVLWYFSRKLPVSLEKTKEANMKAMTKTISIKKSPELSQDATISIRSRSSILTDVGYVHYDEDESDGDEIDGNKTAGSPQLQIIAETGESGKYDSRKDE